MAHKPYLDDELCTLLKAAAGSVSGNTLYDVSSADLPLTPSELTVVVKRGELRRVQRPNSNFDYYEITNKGIVALQEKLRNLYNVDFFSIRDDRARNRS